MKTNKNTAIVPVVATVATVPALSLDKAAKNETTETAPKFAYTASHALAWNDLSETGKKYVKGFVYGATDVTFNGKTETVGKAYQLYFREVDGKKLAVSFTDGKNVAKETTHTANALKVLNVVKAWRVANGGDWKAGFDALRQFTLENHVQPRNAKSEADKAARAAKAADLKANSGDDFELDSIALESPETATAEATTEKVAA